MKNVVLALLVTGLTFAGCGGKEAPPAPAANPTPQPAAGMPSLAATAEASPPPGAPAAIAAPGAAPEVPTYEGKDEAEKLTKALHDYYERGGAETPLITSLDALVKAGYLKSVPVPPAGKKYVVTTQYPFQVRLESK